MYDELVERLRASVDGRYEKCDGCPYEEDYPCCVDCLDKMHKQAADAIEELICEVADEHNARLDAEERPRWIPVTERLPIRGDAALCIGDNGISIADYVVGDKWCALPWFFVDGEQETGVTHWMPLPSPPAEE